MRKRYLAPDVILLDEFGELDVPNLAMNLQANLFPGVEEIVGARYSIGVYGTPQPGWEKWVEQTAQVATSSPAQRVVIPVDYTAGEDLNSVAEALGLSIEEVIQLHSSTDYRCFAIGFQPGFGYLGPLPEALRGLPRRASPRRQVPPGSVAICLDQTAVYPSASPGGWHLIGRTYLELVDLSRDYFSLEVGAVVKFEVEKC